MKMEGLYEPRKKDAQKIINTLGEAFLDYPIFQWSMEGDALRKAHHRKIMTVFNNLGHKYGRVIATSEQCEGIIMFARGKESNLTNLQLLRCGILKVLVSRWGRKWLSKFDHVSRANDTIREKNASSPYIYIWFVAVLPEYQEKGFARKLLDEVLKRVDEENLACYLETYKPKNVKIYQNFGFKLVEEYQIPQTPLILYSMLRQSTGHA